MKVQRKATKRPVRKYKFCTFLKCPKQAQGATRNKGAIGLCKGHGGNPCKKLNPDGTACKFSAYSSTGLCINHGGNPCKYIDGNSDKCTTGARGSTGFCFAHKGGPRCQGFNKDGTECGRGAIGATGFCITHKGGRRCPNCIDWIDSRGGQKKYDGYCATCYHRLFPNTTRRVFRNYKTKEYAVLRHLEQHFPTHHIVNDRRVSDGCSKKKPDFFFELLTHVIMVEVDDQSCENKRMMELSEDIAHRPLVFIRFNPDKTSSGPGCWGYDKTGRAVVKKSGQLSGKSGLRR